MPSWEVTEGMQIHNWKSAYRLVLGEGFIEIIIFEYEDYFDIDINNDTVSNTNISIDDAKRIAVTEAIEMTESAHRELLKIREEIKGENENGKTNLESA